MLWHNRFYGEDATSTNGEYRAAGYTVELRDTGQYGFLLPPEQVQTLACDELGTGSDIDYGLRRLCHQYLIICFIIV